MVVEIKPRLLLIGAGVFGKNYVKAFKKLQQQNKIEFKGVVVQTQKTQKEISQEYTIPVFTELSLELLQHVDAVFIATPPHTHYSLVKQCLPYAHVFVEKPLTESYISSKELVEIAEKSSRILMVGHIFRFHPVVKKLKMLITETSGLPSVIRGWFTNPRHTDNGRDISLEMLHYYDILDYIFNSEPLFAMGQIKERIQTVSLRYFENTNAILELGWAYDEKKRILEFLYPQKKRIRCDFLNNSIEIAIINDHKEKSSEMIHCYEKQEPLEEEINLFLEVISGKKLDYPNGEIGAKIVKIAQSISFLPKNKKPTIAIIGAGMFGTNCAIELGKYYDVTLFEKNDEILREASFINQYRHHWGYHYPRSVETVHDIIKSTESFESMYNKAIIRNFPTYYCVAKEGSHVTAEEYITFCEKNGLPFTLEYPDSKYVNRNMICASLKTLEPIYDFDILQKLINAYLVSTQNISLSLHSEVIGGFFETDGRKTLIIKKDGVIERKSFDYVINVTYANLNKFAYWFHFPIKPLRLELVEALIVKLPIPKLSFAFMDGPFTNMVPTSKENLFTLVHIKHSILYRDVLSDGLIPDSWRNYTSNEKQILEESKKWMPILDQAEVIEKRYVFRGVNAYREHDDARPSDIICHGFGCWSVLGGKLINSVSTARKISSEINELHPALSLK